MRRALYVGDPDDLGEYPVLYTDIDDGMDLGVMYPGFGVFMAEYVELFQLSFSTDEGLASHPSFKDRLKRHQRQLFGKRGKPSWSELMDASGEE